MTLEWNVDLAKALREAWEIPSPTSGDDDPSKVTPLLIRAASSPSLLGEVEVAARPALLDAPFDSLGPRASEAGPIYLDAFSNRLDMAQLRRFAHRISYLLAPDGRAGLLVRDPDWCAARDRWPGERLDPDDADSERFRPWRHYLELSRLFPLVWRTPKKLGDSSFWILELKRENPGESFHFGAPGADEGSSDSAEEADRRYGRDSLYRRFDRLEEPEILDDLLYGISRFRLKPGDRVLSLGCNDGRELELVAEAAGEGVEVHGVDLADSAIAAARRRFPDQAENFHADDLSRLRALDLPPMQGIMVLNTFQCGGLDREALLKEITRLLTKRGAVLFSIPNCHHGTFDLLRRPLDRKDPRHDRALVQKDVRYLTRYFYRAGFKAVENFGTYDAMVLARRS